MPAAQGSAPVLCTTCVGDYANLPTWQYSAPIKSFTGRFMDSNGVREFQLAPRTRRAEMAAFVPERNRVYMNFGASCFASYKLSTFFTQDLGQPLTRINRQVANPETDLEKYLQPMSIVDAELGGWNTGTTDGQDRFVSFDWDDRDYVYLGFGPWGFGIAHDNGAEKLPKVSQVMGLAGAVVALKAAPKYYLVVLNFDNSRVFDVTNAAAPVPSAFNSAPTVPFGGHKWVKASSGGQDRLALIDNSYKNLSIWRAADFVNGRPAEATFSAGSNTFADVTTDGTNFYAVESAGNQAVIWVIKPTGSGGFTETKYPTGPHFYASTLDYGSGYLTMIGQWSGPAPIVPGYDVRLFRLVNLVPQEIALNEFFKKYYYNPPRDSAGKPLYAVPNNMLAEQAVVYKHEGKEYLLFSGNGIGDVFELQTRQLVRVSVETGRGWGTANPYSKKKDIGPFYGDKIPLNAFYDPAIPINWNFDNPESPGTNTLPGTAAPAPAGAPTTYQYSGLTDEKLIKQKRTITATQTNDPSNTDSTTVQLRVPEVRFGIYGTDILFTEPNANSTAPIVSGDVWYDGSDGSVEGHSSSWVREGGATVTQQPDVGFDVGPCGSRSLILQAKYGPSRDYLVSLGPVNYTVRPFAAVIALKGYDERLIRFASASRPATLPTDAKLTWEVIRAGVATPLQPNSDGSVDVFKPVLPGDVVRLTVSAPATSLPAGCEGHTSSVAEYLMTPPDPEIIDLNCTHTNSGCTLTAKSTSGRDELWSYMWTATPAGAAIPAPTGKTVSPSFSQAGTYTFTVTATNAFGTQPASKSFKVDEPVCAMAPKKDWISISHHGAQNAVQFTAHDWPPFYKFQECDKFSWVFGNGQTSNLKEPPPQSFNDGSYTVTLTVSNTAPGSSPAVVTYPISFGTVTPPNPGTCPPPTGQVLISFTGSSSGCSVLNPNCQNGETIRFTADPWAGFNPQQCHVYSWAFGDGSSGSGATPSKAYTSNGSKTVRVTVTGGGGSITSTVNLNIVGNTPTPPDPGGCPTVSPGRFIEFTYAGATSACSDGNGNECLLTETISFETTVFGYNFQTCDTFTWDFGDGKTGAGKSVTHSYTGFAGPTAKVKLTVSNSKGKTEFERTIKFAGAGASAPTNVVIQAPSTGSVNLPVTFLGTATFPANAQPGWSWTVTDVNPPFAVVGQSSANPATFTFTRAGTFRATLVASNRGVTAPPVSTQIVVTDGVPFAFVLPVVTHVTGRNGVQWRTDLHVYNPNPLSQPLKLTADFGGHSTTLDITTSTMIYTDFLKELTSRNDAGPVLIRGTAAKAPQLWTRTYSLNPGDTGGFGQLIPAIPLEIASGELSADSNSYIAAGLRNDSQFRTNVGVLNLSPIPTEVTVTAFDDRINVALGAFTVDLEPFHLFQMNLSQRMPELPTRPFSLRFTSSLAVPLMAYVSEVDNFTNDARFVTASAESTAAASRLKQQVLPAVAPSEWRTDMTVFNTDTNGITFNLVYYDSSGNRVKELPMSINGRSFVNLENVFGAQYLNTTSTTAVGTLRVETVTEAASYPLVSGRSYKLRSTGGGTFGQSFSAFAAGDANVQLNKPGFIAGVRNDAAYSTRIGLINSGSEPALIKVTLIDKATGADAKQWSWALNPNQSYSDDVFTLLGSAATEGTLRIEVTSGAVWAYASIFAKDTGDPVYVPAAQQ